MVSSPNNPMTEEALILEGFRFIDRLGKADSDLADRRKMPSDASVADEDENVVNNLVEEDAPPQTKLMRNAAVPEKLRFSLRKEPQLVCNESKCIKSEFEDLNKKLINSVKSKSVKRKFNVPKRTRDALKRLKTLVREKVVDIRKVDKGQLILIIDYSERKLIEEMNISKIATLCDDQKSNWEDNRDYVEDKLKLLLRLNFITREELTAVTGLLAGGKFGHKKNSNGYTKFTHVLSMKELFSKQVTPYVYPLLKAHKVPFKELL